MRGSDMGGVGGEGGTLTVTGGSLLLSSLVAK